MAPGNPTSTRKRPRSRISDQADELSPLPASTPVSATKRRKVDTTTSKFSGLLDRAKKLLPFGVKERDNSADELGDEIYDFKITDDEKESPQVDKKGKSKSKESRSIQSTAAEATASPRRKVGRPRKTENGLENVKAESRQTLHGGRKEDEEGDDSVYGSASRDGKIRPTATSTKLLSSRNITSASRRSHSEEQSAGISTPSRLSNVSQRGRPKGNPSGLTNSHRVVSKGILTPSKSSNPSARKSVAFEESGNGRLEGFKDIPTETCITKPTKKKIPERENTDDDDDPVCQICTKPDSRPPNLILFCDGCPLAVHQKCYSIPKIPDGDWYCKKCVRARVAEEVAHKELREDTADAPDDTEISCAVCKGLKSKPPNNIILCDKCDYAVHQICGGIPRVPRGDWFCKECIKADVEGDKELVSPRNEIPNIQEFESHLEGIQRVLLDRLVGQTQIELRGHDEEMQKVQQLVEQTVLAGEGNSMLIIGSRGSGKTTLVESVISDVSRDHRDNFHVVRLNGFIHTDDRLALREIWRQLGREMEIEEDSNSKINNYADTLASLLALLSHPSEISQLQTDHAAKSVVFVLDEFDRFTTHSRQTLLYNLFDIAQARKAPIAVIGLTTRVDVVESLEKRVKSRFSHRYIHLSLPKSLPAFWDICKSGLLVNRDDYGANGSDFPTLGQDDFLSYWQSMIEDLYTSDVLFKRHLQSQFYRSKSVSAFFTSCILPIATLTTGNFPLCGRSFSLVPNTLLAPDSKLHVLPGLSDLELAMLIAAARLDIILDTETCNFAMAYDEYSSLTSRHKIQTSSTGVTALGGSAKVWGREVALGAWERLVDYDLLIPASIGAAQAGGLAGRMWKVDVALEEIPASVEGLTGIMLKWCREI